MSLPGEVTIAPRELEGGHGGTNDIETNVTAVIRVLDQESKHDSKDSVVIESEACVEKEIASPNDRGKKRGLTKRQMYPNKSAKANSGKLDGSFTSKFRGVTRHRLTNRFEAHFWDSSYERPKSKSGTRRKGRQVYLGGYITEEDAARAYDMAAIAFLGSDATLNYDISEYQEYMKENKGKSADLVVGELRRKSVGFARGSSQYRGVTKNKKCLRWEARIGKVIGNKYLYLGIFDDPKLAAIAYDKAAVKFFGTKAMTNFQLQDYQSILDNPDSHSLPLHGQIYAQEAKENMKKKVEKTAPVETNVPKIPSAMHSNPPPPPTYMQQVEWYQHQENMKKKVEKTAPVETNVPKIPSAMHSDPPPPPTYMQQVEWYQHHLKSLQSSEQQRGYLTAGEVPASHFQQPYATMTYDFDGNRTGNPHQQQHAYERMENQVDLSHLSPLAASLLSPLGIPKEQHGYGPPESSGHQDCRIDSVSAEALRTMTGPPSPFTQGNNLQGGFDLDNLGWIDSVDVDQIAMMLRNVSSPKPGSAYQ